LPKEGEAVLITRKRGEGNPEREKKSFRPSIKRDCPSNRKWEREGPEGRKGKSSANGPKGEKHVLFPLLNKKKKKKKARKKKR